MHILQSKYWTKFKKTIVTKDGKKKIVKDGKKFEDLIKRILDLEYGENRWKPTSTTWDGSRDFEYYEQDSYKWAECKNYSANISLNVISNTLVMAMIDFADEILIFSYSKIKRPALKKLIQFADISQKSLKIFADDSLEEIILVHIADLRDDFFPNFLMNEKYKQSLPPYVSCNIFCDPVTAYTMDMNLGCIPRKPTKINFDSILCLSVLIFNQSARDISVTIKLNWDNTKNCFKPLNCNGEESLQLAPNTTIIKKIYFKTVIYKKILRYPSVIVSSENFYKCFPFGSTKCSWIGECSLQGYSYKKIKGQFQGKLFNSPFFRGLNIYGTSGTGKSRLLKESEHMALANGFRVVRFSVDKKNNTENFVEKIIAEFICTLYDIPNLEEYIQASNSSNLNEIYSMILTIKSHQIQQPYLKEIVVPIIVQKLMYTKCYISFDNLQYFPDQFISFLNDLVENLLLTNQHCKSRMGFTFNTDYIYNQDECMDFYSKIISNKENLYNVKLKGFASNGEATVFLNQLMPNMNIDSFYIDKIIDASDNNPFYIKSYLEQLETEGILCQKDDCYVIMPFKYNEFTKNVSNISENVRETVKNRWNYYLLNHDEDSSIKILSLLHIFQYLNNNLVEKFSLSKSLIIELHNYHFLKTETGKEVVYYFEHDLTENFFSQEYFPLCKHAIISETAHSLVDNYWYSVVADIKYDRNMEPSHCKKIIAQDIPYKTGREIYDMLINCLLPKINSVIDLEKYLEILTMMCSNIRELYGTQESITFYQKIVNKVTTAFPTYQDNKHWAWLIISYCNLLYEQGQYDEAISTMNNLLYYWPEKDITSDNVIIYGYLYNRLHVYNRALEYQVTCKSLGWLEKSERLVMINDEPELLFLNFIDRGYCAYDCLSSKPKIVRYWGEACKIYEKNNLITKKPNYYYAKICIELLNYKLKEARITIMEAIRIIETKEEGTYYYTYFKQRYLFCLITSFLLDSIENKKQIEDYFSQVEKLNYIQNKKMGYSIHWLKSIFYFLTKQYQDSIINIEDAINLLQESKKKTFCDIYLDQLYGNAEYVFAKYMINNNFSLNLNQLNNHMLIKKLNKIMQMSNSELLKFINTHKATGLLQTIDQKISFPVL